MDNRGSVSQPAAGLEEKQGLSQHSDIVNADDLDALGGVGEGTADGAGGAVGRFVADQLADKSLARVTDEERAAEIVKAVGVGHECGVVLMCLTEADAGIEADSVVVDARGN